MRYIFLIAIPFFLFACGNSVDYDKKIDSMFPQQKTDSSRPTDNSKKDSSDDNVVKPFHLSPADSIKVADSIAKTKNPIRDFN